MNVSLLIPIGFEENSEGDRRREILKWVLLRWAALFPDIQICFGKPGRGDGYNRSQARNRAFQQADGDILILTDADTITRKENVEAAIDIVMKTNGWVIAHETYYSVTKEYTDIVLEWPPDCSLNTDAFSLPGQYDWVMRNKSEAGVLVMPRESYEEVEGYDERFQGWGYEDNAFAAKLRRVSGEPQRTKSFVAHLWHPRGLDFEQPHIRENEALLEEVKRGL